MFLDAQLRDKIPAIRMKCGPIFVFAICFNSFTISAIIRKLSSIIRVYQIADNSLPDLIMSSHAISMIDLTNAIVYSFAQILYGFMKYSMIQNKTVLLLSVVIMLVGSLFSGLATSLLHLHIGQVFIGLGTAPLFGCLVDIVSSLEFEDSPKVISVLCSASQFGAILSGLLCPIISEVLGWRSTYLISALYTVLSIAFIAFGVPTDKEEKMHLVCFDKSMNLVSFELKTKENTEKETLSHPRGIKRCTYICMFLKGAKSFFVSWLPFVVFSTFKTSMLVSATYSVYFDVFGLFGAALVPIAISYYRQMEASLFLLSTLCSSMILTTYFMYISYYGTSLAFVAYTATCITSLDNLYGAIIPNSILENTIYADSKQATLNLINGVAGLGGILQALVTPCLLGDVDYNWVKILSILSIQICFALCIALNLMYMLVDFPSEKNISRAKLGYLEMKII